MLVVYTKDLAKIKQDLHYHENKSRTETTIYKIVLLKVDFKGNGKSKDYIEMQCISQYSRLCFEHFRTLISLAE